jgi:predicted RND superfamily exporter protein
VNRFWGFSLAHPKLTLGVVVLLTIVLGSGMRQLELRTDGSAIYPNNNATVELNDQDKRTFHEREQIMLLLTSTAGGPEVASPPGLQYLRYVHREIGGLPSVHGDGVMSAASLIDLHAAGESISVEPILDSIPEWSLAFTDRLQRLRRHPLTNGLYLSQDGRTAALYVPLASDATRSALLSDVQHFIKDNSVAPFSLRMTGPLVAEATLGERVVEDLTRVVPIMVLVIAIMLLFTLRSAGGVLLPMLEALVVLITTLGLMGWAGAPVTLVTTILPVLVMTMAITDEIHLLHRIQTKVRDSKGQPMRDVVRQSLEEVGGRPPDHIDVCDHRAGISLILERVHDSHAGVWNFCRIRHSHRHGTQFHPYTVPGSAVAAIVVS